eukprot:Hpha_TRINITY_DN1934_c0_g1::TRINITY_DN1934_c0_g1_i2::g.31177::m.31177
MGSARCTLHGIEATRSSEMCELSLSHDPSFDPNWMKSEEDPCCSTVIPDADRVLFGRAEVQELGCSTENKWDTAAEETSRAAGRASHHARRRLLGTIGTAVQLRGADRCIPSRRSGLSQPTTQPC